MENNPCNQLSGDQAGERAALPTSPKRKPGRPLGTTKDALEARKTGGMEKVGEVQLEQRKVISRQRLDCRKLGTVIGKALPGTEDPKDIASLARSTAILHDLERAAYDFGATPGQVKAVIVVPMVAGSMETWQQASTNVLGQVLDAVAGPPARRIEADVIDMAEEGSEE